MTTLAIELCDAAITDFLYTYDMGDDWHHRVQVLETLEQSVGSE